MSSESQAAPGPRDRPGIHVPSAAEEPAALRDLVRLSYDQVPFSLLATIVNALLLAAVQAGEVSSVAMGAWLALVATATAIRLLLLRSYQKREDSTRDEGWWARVFVLCAAMAGAAWGASALLLFPDASVERQMFQVFVVGGMVAGAVVVLSPLRTSFLLYAAFMLVPLFARFAFERHDLVPFVLGLIVVFSGFMVLASSRVHRLITESLALRHDNRELVSSLRREHERQEALNQELTAEISEREAAQQALTESHEHLELRVQERTNELSAVVERLQQEVAQRIRAQDALRESEERYRALFDENPSMYCVVAADGTILATNPYGAEQLGYDPAGLVGRSILETTPDSEREQVRTQLGRCIGSPGTSIAWSTRKLRSDGTVVTVRETGRAIRRADGSTNILIVCEDTTERDLLEQQLRQAQKMEALGRLTGGIAHDFNNLLTVIVGYSRTALQLLEDGSPFKDDIRAIADAGDRASALTRQLLAFSRQQVVQPEVLDLAEIVRREESLLTRVLAPGVELGLDLPDGPALIRADAGHVEQVLMNLVVNASDAMPKGGEVVVAVTVDRGSPVSPSANGWVDLMVRDNGCGMDEATQSKIFDPFFTTKDVGKGTGLGLSTVYGIVAQHGGEIAVDSRFGVGTTLRIRFPAAESRLERTTAEDAPDALPGGTEVLLLVEDDVAIRTLTSRVLASCGYTVLDAGTAEDGLRILDSEPADLAMVISDIQMPGLNGIQFVEAAKARKPRIKTLLISGNISVNGDGSELESPFLQKPFTPATLTRTIREILDGC